MSKQSKNKYRNELNYLLRRTKKQYYSHFFEEHKINMKSWEGIKSLLGQSSHGHGKHTVKGTLRQKI